MLNICGGILHGGIFRRLLVNLTRTPLLGHLELANCGDLAPYLIDGLEKASVRVPPIAETWRQGANATASAAEAVDTAKLAAW